MTQATPGHHLRPKDSTSSPLAADKATFPDASSPVGTHRLTPTGRPPLFLCTNVTKIDLYQPISATPGNTISALYPPDPLSLKPSAAVPREWLQRRGELITPLLL